MERNKDYTGNVELAWGLKPKNNGTFPLMEARDILVGSDDLRLDDKLSNIDNALGSYIQDIGKIVGGSS